jgi:transcriptional regulator NrdR family protein
MADKPGWREGIPCPECGSFLSEVIQTRRWSGCIVRRRRCFDGHVFHTQEHVGGDNLFRASEAERSRYRKKVEA